MSRLFLFSLFLAVLHSSQLVIQTCIHPEWIRVNQFIDYVRVTIHMDGDPFRNKTIAIASKDPQTFFNVPNIADNKRICFDDLTSNVSITTHKPYIPSQLRIIIQLEEEESYELNQMVYNLTTRESEINEPYRTFWANHTIHWTPSPTTNFIIFQHYRQTS